MRRASRGDLSAVEELCRTSVGADDYVIGYLRWEVENCHVHVALDGNRIVGMATYRPVIDGSGWLAMARTRPDYRRQGVNRAIVDSYVRLARRNGVRRLRLWTNAGNVDGMATFSAVGFREVARFTRIQAAARSGRVESRPRTFDARLWRRIASSALVRMGNGFVPHGWEFVRADRVTAKAIAASGAMRGWGPNLLAAPDLPRPVPEDSPLQLTMWAGNPDAILGEGRRLAAAKGLEFVGTYVPHRPQLLRRATRAGYEIVKWGDEAVLCELAVPPPRRRRPTGSARAGRTRS